MARNASATSPSTRCLVSVGFLATPPRYGSRCAGRIALQVDAGITREAYDPRRYWSPEGDVPAGVPADARGMTTTQSLSRPVGAVESSAQYSLPKILGIWASVTVPMAVLAFVVAPAIMPHTSLHPGLVHWIAMV